MARSGSLHYENHRFAFAKTGAGEQADRFGYFGFHRVGVHDMPARIRIRRKCCCLRVHGFVLVDHQLSAVFQSFELVEFDGGVSV